MKFLVSLLLSFLLFVSPSWAAFSFPENDTSGDHNNLTLADNTAFNFPDGDWTLAGWLKLDDNTGTAYQYFFSWGSFQATPSFNLAIGETSGGDGPDDLLFDSRDDDGDLMDVNSTSNPFSSNTSWTHVIMQRSGTTITGYIDNSSVLSSTDATFDAINVAGDLHFGNRSDNATARRYGGDMAEWAKWDKALDANERQALVDGASPLTMPQSLTWYVPMVRNEVELLNNPSTTSADLTVASHPITYYPSAPFILTAPAAAAATAPPMRTLFGVGTDTQPSILQRFLDWLWSFLLPSAHAQQLAFPGAEGFGRFSVGGRGGAVCQVTTTADSDPGTAGQLRNCLEVQTGARTVVFTVGGTIDCQSGGPMIITDGKVTVAGQTAPGDGILIKGCEFNIRTSDVIVRHIRLRPGDPGASSFDNGFSVGSVTSGDGDRTDVIFDHVSSSWAEDENVTLWTEAKQITVQWSFIGESFNNPLKSSGIIVGGSPSDPSTGGSILNNSWMG